MRPGRRALSREWSGEAGITPIQAISFVISCYTEAEMLRKSVLHWQEKSH
jgi:hypothetical protein